MKHVLSKIAYQDWTSSKCLKLYNYSSVSLILSSKACTSDIIHHYRFPLYFLFPFPPFFSNCSVIHYLLYYHHGCTHALEYMFVMLSLDCM